MFAKTPKTPSLSAIRGLRIANTFLRGHMNTHGTLYGGHLMSLMDQISAEVAMQHTKTLCVTRRVDSLDFIAPVSAKDDLLFWSCVNNAWGTSLEVGMRVCARKPGKQQRHVVSAYFTFVAIDVKTGQPMAVPGVVPETKAEKKRFIEAESRRAQRLKEK